MSEQNTHHDDLTGGDVPRSVWQSYTHDAEDEPMLAAAEVRRLGDRRRTRRRVGVASAALGLTLLAGSALALNTDLFGQGTPPIAGSPTPSVTSTSPTAPSPTPARSDSPSQSPSQSQSLPQSPASSVPQSSASKSTSSSASTTSSSTAKTSPLTSAVLPTGAEIYLIDPNDLSFEDSTSFGYPGESTAHGMCEPELALSEFPSSGKISRYFAGPAEGVSNPQDYGDYEVKTFVMQFDSLDEARKALVTIGGWYDNCSGSLKSTGGQIHAEPSLTEAGATIRYWTGQPAAIDPSEDSGPFQDTLLVQKGTRVLLMIEAKRGQDNNCVGPANSKLPDQPAGLCRFVNHYPQVIERLDN